MKKLMLLMLISLTFMGMANTPSNQTQYYNCSNAAYNSSYALYASPQKPNDPHVIVNQIIKKGPDGVYHWIPTYKIVNGNKVPNSTYKSNLPTFSDAVFPQQSAYLSSELQKCMDLYA